VEKVAVVGFATGIVWPSVQRSAGLSEQLLFFLLVKPNRQKRHKINYFRLENNSKNQLNT